jgi:hypothetical protein
VSTSIVLGQEIIHNEKPHLVVRIIDKSISLFEDDNACFVVEESYAELRGPNNEVEFVTILTSEQPFANKKSTIKGLPTLPWRIKR